MKKIFIFLALICISTILIAQNDVTKFLGIPVDGTKATMVQKLKAKGFTYDATNDYLKGQFNGRTSEVYVATNNNKVYRIMVSDAVGTSEAEIRIRFNNLCKQFENNEKYIPQNFIGGYEIDGNEDISYEMVVNNKRYQAAYYQVSAKEIDTITINNFVNDVQKLYTEEEMQRISENGLEGLSDEDKTKAKQLWDMFLRIFSHKSVWFMISEEYGRYYINIYYDNELNMANGEDL